MMLLAKLLLAAVPMLEPQTSLPRLQPREMDAITQDHQAWAVTDDDASTAFVFSPAKKNELAVKWVGAHVEGLTALHVFIRPGCQQSDAELARYARPKQVTIEVSTARRFSTRLREEKVGGRELPAPKQVTFALADQKGWQEMVVPMPAGVTSNTLDLRVKSSWPSKESEKICISDLRVYGEGGAVDTAEEQRAGEAARKIVSEWLVAKQPSRMAALYVRHDVPLQPVAKKPIKGELALQADDPGAANLRIANALMRTVTRLPRTPAKLIAAGYQRAAISSVLADDASRETAAADQRTLSGDLHLLAIDDFTLVPTEDPSKGLRARFLAVSKTGGSPLMCRTQCQPMFAAASSSAMGARVDCSDLCGTYSTDMRSQRARIEQDISLSGVFYKGEIGAPSEVVVLTSRFGGERESYRHNFVYVKQYENGRAVRQVSRFDDNNLLVELITWNEERTKVAAVDTYSYSPNYDLPSGKLELDSISRDEAPPEHASR